MAHTRAIIRGLVTDPILTPIRTPIRTMVLDELPHLDALEDDADLLAPGMLDSLAIIRVVAALEDAEGITIEQSEIEPTNFRSLATIRAFVAAKKAAATTVAGKTGAGKSNA